MTTKEFSAALGNIDAHYIDEAAAYAPTQKRRHWIKWSALAACLTLILAGGIWGKWLHAPDVSELGDSIASYFIITAHAENGESTELGVASSCFNSSSGKNNIFGVDMPLFHFDVKPSDLNSDEAVYERFDISISYNGTVVTGKDEHIFVAYIFYRGTSQTGGYSIIGWFTEPTDVVITITDKESQMVAEEITVNVTYLPDRQEYELTVVDWMTQSSEQPKKENLPEDSES